MLLAMQLGGKGTGQRAKCRGDRDWAGKGLSEQCCQGLLETAGRASCSTVGGSSSRDRPATPMTKPR